MSNTQTYRVSPPLNKTYLSRTHLLTQLPFGRKKNIQSQIDQFSYCSNVFDYIIQLITKKKKQMKNSYAKIIIITHGKLRLEIWTWIIFCPMQNWPLLRDYKVEEERGDCGHGGVATGSKFDPVGDPRHRARVRRTCRRTWLPSCRGYGWDAAKGCAWPGSVASTLAPDHHRPRRSRRSLLGVRCSLNLFLLICYYSLHFFSVWSLERKHKHPLIFERPRREEDGTYFFLAF